MNSINTWFGPVVRQIHTDTSLLVDRLSSEGFRRHNFYELIKRIGHETIDLEELVSVNPRVDLFSTIDFDVDFQFPLFNLVYLTL